MKEILLPIHKIVEIANNYSVTEITEEKAVVSTLVNRLQYVTVRCWPSKSGYDSVEAFEMVPLDSYEGRAVSYSDHLYLVSTGKRERGYEGIIVSNKGYRYVLTNPVTFKPNGTELIQLSLF